MYNVSFDYRSCRGDPIRRIASVRRLRYSASGATAHQTRRSPVERIQASLKPHCASEQDCNARATPAPHSTEGPPLLRAAAVFNAEVPVRSRATPWTWQRGSNTTLSVTATVNDCKDRQLLGPAPQMTTRYQTTNALCFIDAVYQYT
jgi:hypothetical protein